MKETLWPREHGAYAQLAFPLLSGILAGRPSLSGLALAASAIFLFLAHEPASVLLGVRGSRARRTWSSAAIRRLAWLAPAGVLFGIVGLVTASSTTLWLTAIPFGLGLAMIPLLFGKSIKTLPGEILLAAACAGMHLPIAHAGGVTGERLWAPAILWFVVFGLAILTVHAIKARQNPERNDRVIRRLTDVTALLSFLAVIVLVTRPDYRWPALAGFVPVVATAVVNFERIPAGRLKLIGWTVVAADVAALIVMTAWARTAGS